MSKKRSNRNNNKVLKSLKQKRLKAHRGTHTGTGQRGNPYRPHSPNSASHKQQFGDESGPPPGQEGGGGGGGSTPPAEKTEDLNLKTDAGTIEATISNKEAPIGIDISPKKTPEVKKADVAKLDVGDVRSWQPSYFQEQAGISTDVKEVADPEDIKAEDARVTRAYRKAAGVRDAATPTEFEAGQYTATEAEDLAPTKAAQGTVSDEAVADPDEIRTLTERAVGAKTTAEEKESVLARDATFVVNPKSLVPSVTGEDVNVSPTSEAEKQTRKQILGNPAPDGDEAVINDVVGYEAYQRRTVKGTAAKSGAADAIAAIGELPPDISAAIVEDPATVEAQIDTEPVEVQAAVAALPREALVSSQMETLLASMEEGETPVWARPALAAVEQQLARRGLSTSTVGRDALFNSIIQSALPMAQSNAQALQARAAQNLSNQQQANIEQSRQGMQLRMANLANRQTAESQTAANAQQMAVLQSNFQQQATVLSAQQQQQTRTQNLNNRQQAAILRSQNQQAINAQNLGNEQQMELANLQVEANTLKDNQSAVNRERLAEMQVAADFLSKNAAFKQQMELANLSNDQQMRLANLSSLNQSARDNLNAAQQTELANLNATLQTNLLQAKIAESMGIAQLNVDQQRAITNASTFARIDMTKFNAEQQVELANSKAMQTLVLADLSNEQQATLQNATALASMDMATIDQRTKIAVTNAQSFLAMDMANLNNRQQAKMFDQQSKQQRILSDQAASNAAKQFNATSENQVNQFLTSTEANMNQFNATQRNAMSQFNATESNRISAINANNAIEVSKFNASLDAQVNQFNVQMDLQRDTWNAANAQAVEQSNIEWRRKSNTMDTAAQNASNMLNAQQTFQMDSAEMAFLWQTLRDEATYIRQSYESDQQRKTTLYATALANEVGASGENNSDSIDDLFSLINGIIG